MSEKVHYLIKEETLQEIAQAVRNKTNETGEIVVSELADKINNIEGGGGLDTSDATAAAADILAGKTAYVDGNKITGTIPSATQATPSITVNSSTGLITATATQTAGYVSSGTKSATKQLAFQAAKTITPGTTNQTAVAANTYVGGAITVTGDSNLIAGNIKKGTSIFGVTGNYEGSGSGGDIPSNPTASFKKDVNFYDYDGTLLYSYTVAEAQALTELPPLPVQPGLFCKGWNYDLATIKSYNRAVNIGATYITDDRKTRLYIRIAAEGRMKVPLYFSQTVSNGVTIDWGDGSATQKISGTGNKNTTHTYANIGDYVISLSVANGCTLGLGDEILAKCVMGSIGSSNKVYRIMLRKVEIGNGVNINNYAFSNCSSLSSVTIPDSVISIGDNAFENCGLSSVTIPDSVTSIGDNAFCYCYSLSSIVIPDSVTSIGDGAFKSCFSLFSIVIPNGVTSINYDAFENCYSLSSVTIPDGVTNIGNKAFYYCSSLSSIVIPDSVTSIGDNAFYYCSPLSSIVIPDSVTNIGNKAFYYCYGMAIYDFTSHTSVPTLSDADVFGKIPSDCKIKVPAALYDEWITATNWSTHANQIVAV